MKEILDPLKLEDFARVFDKYKAHLKGTKYFKDVHFARGYGEINVFIIRCNPIFVTNDKLPNNDWLIVTTEDEVIIFSCTADPKVRRDKIANSLPQQYYGNIRNHQWIPGRIAICQDYNKVWVRRFIKKGNDWDYYDEQGFFGINIHNNAGFLNSSLGCTILANENRYQTIFKPLLKEVKNEVKQEYIPVTIIQDSVFKNLI